MPAKLVVSSIVAAGAALVLGASAHAAVSVGASAPRWAPIAPIENAQFSWGGRRYCWYGGGWRGPGWYRCGFAWRRGLGWGGGWGWHGWRAPGMGNRPPPMRPGGPGMRPRPGGPGPGVRPQANMSGGGNM